MAANRRVIQKKHTAVAQYFWRLLWAAVMEKYELAAPLRHLPPVDFCSAYGSALLPNNPHKDGSMVDYILGVSDPLQWHAQNLEMNRHHYTSWMACLGPKAVTCVADKIGVGVHFNPFVEMNGKMIKYGVVRTYDLMQDVVNWNRLYISGRLQKPVQYLVDSLNIVCLNSHNLRAAISMALLFLPPEFTEEDLYAKICSLSYMGDLRMLFAEDKNKVQKIVEGYFNLFRKMYKPFVIDYATTGLLRYSSSGETGATMMQDYSLDATRSLLSHLPPRFRSGRGAEHNEWQKQVNGQISNQGVINSRKEAIKCAEKMIRRTVMASSARQAISGLLAVGGANAVRYVSNKMAKAWKSWR